MHTRSGAYYTDNCLLELLDSASYTGLRQQSAPSGPGALLRVATGISCGIRILLQ